ncbi:MAG: formylglycine-generating enzyme family protein [Planctomycetes bacterium]|nr:formylglycine-generating enzyme family protein [Planctomycetota bacterium]
MKRTFRICIAIALLLTPPALFALEHVNTTHHAGHRHAQAMAWAQDEQENEGDGKIVLDLGDDGKELKMEFVKIKAGTFTMGAKEIRDAAPHEVTISKDYWIQTTETTQAQWTAVMGSNPSTRRSADLPVTGVSWVDCREFIKRLNDKIADQLDGKTAGMPTEAQWEYACRAGEPGRWCFGDDQMLLGEHSWYDKNSGRLMHPVGKKKANAWGLFDMHGNAYEWCEDWYGPYPSETITDPTGPTNGEFRCLRGGSSNYSAHETRSASRNENRPSTRGHNFGLRVVLCQVPPPAGE